MKIDSLVSMLAVNLPLRFASVRLAGVRIGRGSWIKCSAEIGTGSAMGWNFCARGAGKLTIGKYCAIGENVRVITSNHETGRLTMNYLLQTEVVGRRHTGNKLDVAIGNDVWIGDQAIILPGVSIGDGAVIGAGSVVTRPVAPFTVVAGNPAREIRKRFSQKTAEEVARLAWWDWSPAEMKERKALFEERLD